MGGKQSTLGFSDPDGPAVKKAAGVCVRACVRACVCACACVCDYLPSSISTRFQLPCILRQPPEGIPLRLLPLHLLPRHQTCPSETTLFVSFAGCAVILKKSPAITPRQGLYQITSSVETVEVIRLTEACCLHATA